MAYIYISTYLISSLINEHTSLSHIVHATSSELVEVHNLVSCSNQHLGRCMQVLPSQKCHPLSKFVFAIPICSGFKSDLIALECSLYYTIQYTNEYIEGLAPLPATQACTDELAAIMTSESELLPNSPNPDRRLAILFTHWVEMRREQSRTAGPRPNGPTKNDPQELYLGFHLTASEVLLTASRVAPNSLPHSGGNVKDGPNIDILNAGLNVVAYLRTRCMPNSTFLSVWPPAMAAGDLVIYCHKLSKITQYTVNNDLEQIKEHETIFNTKVLPVKEGEPWKRMMWHFGGSRYHPK